MIDHYDPDLVYFDDDIALPLWPVNDAGCGLPRTCIIPALKTTAACRP